MRKKNNIWKNLTFFDIRIAIRTIFFELTSPIIEKYISSFPLNEVFKG